jgi:hypothetical protein
MSEYGQIMAIDFWTEDNTCYCQTSCDCMTDVEDETVILMVSEHLWNLPTECEHEDEWSDWQGNDWNQGLDFNW